MVKLVQNSVCLAWYSFNNIYDQQSAVCQSEGSRYFTVELQMAGRIDEINERIVAEEADGAWFHGDTSILLIEAVIEEFELSGLFFVDDTIGSDEAIGEGGFAVVDVGDDGNVSDFVGGG